MARLRRFRISFHIRKLISFLKRRCHDLYSAQWTCLDRKGSGVTKLFRQVDILESLICFYIRSLVGKLLHSNFCHITLVLYISLTKKHRFCGFQTLSKYTKPAYKILYIQKHPKSSYLFEYWRVHYYGKDLNYFKISIRQYMNFSKQK